MTEHEITSVIRTHPRYAETSDRWCATHQTWADAEGHPFEGTGWLCTRCQDEKRWHPESEQ